MKILADLNQHTKKQDKKPTDEVVYSDIRGSNWIVKLHDDPFLHDGLPQGKKE